MKKLISIILAISMCISVGVMITSCDNNDDTSPKETSAQTEAHVHTWGDGVVTVEPTVEKSGEMTFTCNSCGGTKTETIEFDGVGEENWNTMIAPPSFENYTFRQFGNIRQGDSIEMYQDALIKITKDEMTVHMTSPTDVLLSFVDEEYEMQKGSYEHIFMALLAEYDNYEYDAEAGVYKNPAPVTVNIDMELYGITLTVVMQNGEVTLAEDGKLAKFMCDYTQTTAMDNGDAVVSSARLTWEFYDYGSTVIDAEAE